MEPVTDNEGNYLDTEGEIMDEPSRKIQELAYEEQMYYLLHWGLTYEILVDSNQRTPVTYTIGICQHISNGIIKSFVPTDLTVVGKEQR
ncbi:MAG: hypothetical protein DRI97_06155 [Bacteroidetes bacterium]|nr:MAG: hypothetical protein DRI97_06155 [Bacteroidota bacterium]